MAVGMPVANRCFCRVILGHSPDGIEEPRLSAVAETLEHLHQIVRKRALDKKAPPGGGMAELHRRSM
jgi:hypothetical protein